MLLPEATTHDAVLLTVRQAKATNLESVELFDVFRGKGIPEGKKSGLCLHFPGHRRKP